MKELRKDFRICLPAFLLGFDFVQYAIPKVNPSIAMNAGTATTTTTTKVAVGQIRCNHYVKQSMDVFIQNSKENVGIKVLVNNYNILYLCKYYI